MGTTRHRSYTRVCGRCAHREPGDLVLVQGSWVCADEWFCQLREHIKEGQ